jgi:hypothetical protein
MKPLTIKNIDIRNAQLLSSNNTETQFFRFDLDSYAIISTASSIPSFGFKSLDFSALLDSIEDDITDVMVLSTTCESRENKPQKIEVRLSLGCGDQICLNCQGEMSRISPLIKIDVEEDERTAKPVREVWGNLPEELEKMVFTRDLIQRLAPDIKKHGAKVVVSRMLLDLEDTNRPLKMEEIVHVNGEWARYAVTELRSGRAVYMTPEEVMPADENEDDEVF